MSLLNCFRLGNGRLWLFDLENYLVPVNLAEERQKFMDFRGDKLYNPKFQYDEEGLAKLYRTTKRMPEDIEGVICDYFMRGDWYSKLLRILLTNRRWALESILNFLDHQNKGLYALANEDIEQIYTPISPKEQQYALKMYELSRGNKIIDDNQISSCIVSDDETTIYDRGVIENFINSQLTWGNTLFTDEEIEALSTKRLNTEEQIALFRKMISYMEQYTDLKKLDISIMESDELDVPALVRTAPDKCLISVPSGKEVTAEEILKTGTHEINCHYRGVVTTNEMLKTVAGRIRGGISTKWLRSIAEFLSCNADTNTLEGFAMLSELRACLYSTFHTGSMYSVILMGYARQGHSFAEVADLALQMYGDVKEATEEELMDIAWHVASRIYYGVRDTSAHLHYAFSAEQSYFLGPFRILRELARKRVERSENFHSLMRYSPLSISEINLIDGIQLRLGRKIAEDPFAIWDYNCYDYNIPDPTEYLASLLIE